MNDLEGTKKLIRLHQKRLQKLQEQRAIKGINADPALLIEIETVEQELEMLRESAAQNDQGPTPERRPVEKEPLVNGTVGPGPVITITANSGQIAFGSHNLQVESMQGGQLLMGTDPIQIQDPVAGESALRALRQAVISLNVRIRTEAPAERQAAALERLAELEAAITAAPPDLDTVIYVTRWFAKNLVPLAEAVTGLLALPVVDKLMAIDKTIAAEFKRRFR